MNERFTWGLTGIYDNLNNNYIRTYSDMSDLLNKLNDNQRYTPHNYNYYYYNDFFIPKSSVISCYDNIYHRTSRQLEVYLKDNGFLVDNVSRSNIGDKSYYNVEFNLTDDEWVYEKTNDLQIAELLDIKNVGLVDFYKRDGKIHEVILIDESELNDKYLIDGNLKFNQSQRFSCSVTDDRVRVNDNFTDCFYLIEDSMENVELFVEELNKLVEENKLLKKDLEDFGGE